MYRRSLRKSLASMIERIDVEADFHRRSASSGLKRGAANDGELARTDWNLTPADEWRRVGPSYDIAIQSQHLL